MPLPLLVPIGMGVLGLFGLGKGAKAFMTNSEAKKIFKSAEGVVSDAKDALEESREVCNQRLRDFGETKLQVISKEIQIFVAVFSKLKNVNLESSPELDKLNAGNFSELALEELQHSCTFASSLLTGSASGAAAGTITAFGAYGSTMALASAGTGTAITSLSGVAATNATLAWLGGGTLAAGGYGMAGGAVVLGTLVAGPAILVLGTVLGAKAKTKLNEAQTNLEKAQTYDAEVRLVIEKLNAIIQVADFATNLLTGLQQRLMEANQHLAGVVEDAGEDYSLYSEEQQKAVFIAVQYAMLIKSTIDTPILNEDGSLSEKAIETFANAMDMKFV